MDLDYDWAAHDAKKVDKSKPMKTKSKRGPPVQRASLKKPAAKSMKTRSKKSFPAKPVPKAKPKVKASRAMTKQDSLQMTLGWHFNEFCSNAVTRFKVI